MGDTWDENEVRRVGALQNRAPLSIRKIFLLLLTVIAAHCENYSCGEGHLEIALQASTTFLFPLCVLPESRLFSPCTLHWLSSCSIGQDHLEGFCGPGLGAALPESQSQ